VNNVRRTTAHSERRTAQRCRATPVLPRDGVGRPTRGTFVTTVDTVAIAHGSALSSPLSSSRTVIKRFVVVAVSRDDMPHRRRDAMPHH
jgi:hypothetical protein